MCVCVCVCVCVYVHMWMKGEGRQSTSLSSSSAVETPYSKLSSMHLDTEKATKTLSIDEITKKAFRLIRQHLSFP